MSNQNQKLIDGLRAAADLLESKPDMPEFSPQGIRLFACEDKAMLQQAARQLGSFKKTFSDRYFTIEKTLNEAFTIEVYILREAICRRIVTWECPDDESLLKLVEPDQGNCEKVGATHDSE